MPARVGKDFMPVKYLKPTVLILKDVAELMTKSLSSIVEVLAAIVIGIALLQFLIRYTLHLIKRPGKDTTQTIRIKFGSSLAFSLELLLGADILATAIAPTWDEIGKLAADRIVKAVLSPGKYRPQKMKLPMTLLVRQGTTPSVGGPGR